MHHVSEAKKKGADRPGWRRSTRIERIGEFDLNGTAGEIFPLLCPILEYDWLPGWRCTMLYSDSGVAEDNAIFHTTERPGLRAVWTCIAYEPDSFTEYLVVVGTHLVFRLGISLAESRAKTHVVWRMLFTCTSRLAERIIGRMFSEQAFSQMMRDREAQLNHYLSTGTMLSASTR